MKYAIILAFTYLIGCATEPAEIGWLRQPPPLFYKDAVRVTKFYEVVASKAIVAIAGDLKRRAIIPLDSSRAKYFTGPFFKCPEGKKPYLVRAVYGFGGTGSYHLHLKDGALLVSHESIGTGGKFTLSAVIVNLEDEPKELYVTANIVE